MYRCRLYLKYYDQFNLESRYKNALAFPEGTLKFKKHGNKEITAQHENIPGHNNILQILHKRSEKKLVLFHSYSSRDKYDELKILN